MNANAHTAQALKELQYATKCRKLGNTSFAAELIAIHTERSEKHYARAAVIRAAAMNAFYAAHNTQVQ